MNAATRPAACAATPLRFPALPIGGLAGTSFKHEHLAAIRAEGSAARLLRSSCRKLHGRRRAAASRARNAAPRPSALAARRVHVDRRPNGRSTGRIWRASGISSSAMSRRWSPSISPGRRTRPRISTICCRCPTPRRRSRRVCDHIDEVQEAIRRPMLLENPSTYVAFRESTMSETDFIRSVVAAHRMRPAARRQQRLRVRHQSRLLGTRLSVRLSAGRCRRDSSRRSCRTDPTTRANCC